VLAPTLHAKKLILILEENGTANINCLQISVNHNIKKEITYCQEFSLVYSPVLLDHSMI